MPMLRSRFRRGVPLTMETGSSTAREPGLLPLQRINEAFDLMHRGESIRTVVTLLGIVNAKSVARGYEQGQSAHCGAAHIATASAP
jgi:hypothetical protein